MRLLRIHGGSLVSGGQAILDQAKVSLLSEIMLEYLELQYAQQKVLELTIML